MFMSFMAAFMIKIKLQDPCKCTAIIKITAHCLEINKYVWRMRSILIDKNIAQAYVKKSKYTAVIEILFDK